MALSQDQSSALAALRNDWTAANLRSFISQGDEALSFQDACFQFLFNAGYSTCEDTTYQTETRLIEEMRQAASLLNRLENSVFDAGFVQTIEVWYRHVEQFDRPYEKKTAFTSLVVDRMGVLHLIFRENISCGAVDIGIDFLLYLLGMKLTYLDEPGWKKTFSLLKSFAVRREGGQLSVEELRALHRNLVPQQSQLALFVQNS